MAVVSDLVIPVDEIFPFMKGHKFKLVTFYKGHKFGQKGHKFGPKVLTFTKVGGDQTPP